MGTKIILAFSAKPKKPKVVIQKKTTDNKSTVSENSKTTEKIETSTKNSLKKSKPVQINYLQILSQQNHQKLFSLSTIEYRLFKAQVKILVTNIKDNLDYSNVILDRNQFVLNMEPDEEVLLAKIISKNLNYTDPNEVQNCLTDKNYGIYNVIWNQVIMEVANQEESFFPDNQSRSKNVGTGHVQFYKKRLWMVCAGFRMICLIANLVVDRICRKSAAADDQEVKKIVQAIKFDIFMKFHSLMIIFKRRQEAFYIYLIYSHYIGLPNPNIGRESSYYWALKYAIHDFYWYRRVAKYQHLTSTIDELIKKYGGNIKVHDNMNKLKISEKFYNTEILNDRVGHDKMNLFAMELFCGYIFCIKATELMKFEENYFDDFFRSFETELQASLKKGITKRILSLPTGTTTTKLKCI